MSTAETPISPPTVATPTRNRSMDQQYPRPFFGHLMSIENLRPLTRRCDSSSLTHHATVKKPNQPIYIPHCPQCAQRPVICNYCEVPVNKMHGNQNNNSNCPTVATNGISRTNVNTNNMGNTGNNYSQSQNQTTRNNYDNTNDSSNNNNNSNNVIRSATQSNSSQSIRKQPSDHNQNYNNNYNNTRNQVVQSSQVNQVQNQNYADSSQLASNNNSSMQTTTNYNNNNNPSPSAAAGSSGVVECSCQPPLIFPSFRQVMANNPRCGWPLKPYNLGAYPRLPGQSPEDPPCFSQTIAHRPSQIVVPDLYTSTAAAAPRPIQPNSNYNPSFQSPSSFGALGDCCTTRRSSNTQFTPYKSQNNNLSNPSCCGDDDSYRSPYNN